MEFEVIRKLFDIKQNDGFSEEDIHKACEKYGNLPLVLREYYRQLGNYEQINQAQNILCHPHNVIETKEYLIFYIENQYVTQWAIKRSDLDKDNPSVYCSWDESEFHLESEYLLNFLYAMAFFQAAYGGLQYCPEEIYIISHEQAQTIRSRYKKKDYELHQWLDISYYGNHEDEVICMIKESDCDLIKNGDYDMIYASSSKQHFDQIKEFMDKLQPDTY